MAEYDESRRTVVDHPLVQHKLSILRDKRTSTKDFRELVTELAILEGYEALRDLPLEDVEVETPLETMTGKRIAGPKLAIIPITIGFAWLRNAEDNPLLDDFILSMQRMLRGE